jgi:hypothetical protein
MPTSGAAIAPARGQERAMTAPKKPAKPPTRPKAAAFGDPLIQMTCDERELLAAYRATDNANQYELLKIMKLTAIRAPRRVTPSLRLVIGGAA